MAASFPHSSGSVVSLVLRAFSQKCEKEEEEEESGNTTREKENCLLLLLTKRELFVVTLSVTE